MEGERVYLFYLVEGEGAQQPIQRFIMRWGRFEKLKALPRENQCDLLPKSACCQREIGTRADGRYRLRRAGQGNEPALTIGRGSEVRQKTPPGLI